MLETLNSEERSRRAALIRQAIARGAGRFFGGEKLLYHIADYILLAFQSPSCFSIWDQCGSLIFSSFRDPYLVRDDDLKSGRHLVHPERCKIELSLLSHELAHYYVTLHNVTPDGFTPFDSERLQLLREVFLAEGSPQYSDSFPNAIVRAINEHKQAQWSDSDCSDAKPMTSNQVDTYLQPMRHVLDEAFGELREHQSFSVNLPDGTDIPNVFAVVRTVRQAKKRLSCFPYTASLLLSNSQRDRLPSICRATTLFPTTMRRTCDKRKCGQRCISLLEAPLSLDARAIYDSVFYSGCVDFSLIGEVGEAGLWRDIPGNATTDKHRQEVERCVYGVLTGGRQSQIMYVPIHIGGVPWLSLFTLIHVRDQSAWDDTYCFYRDLIAKLSDRLRLGAQNAYLDTLMAEFKKCMQLFPTELFSAVNKKWLQVSQVYPYSSFSLQPTAPSNRAISMLRGVYADLKEMPNPFCSSQLNYGQFQPELLYDRLQQELNLLVRIDHESDEGMRDRLQSQAHTILNNLPMGTLRKAVAADDPEDVRKFANDALFYAEIAEIGLLIALERELPHAFPVNKSDKTVNDILHWIRTHQPSDKLSPEFHVDPAAAAIKISDSLIPSAFTVIWNLWHNAETVARGNRDPFFSVALSMSQCNDWVEVTFQNSGQMDADWIRFLRHEAASPNKRRHRRRGLEIVMAQLPILRWSLIPPDLPPQKITKLTLRIPHKDTIRQRVE